MKIWWKSWWAKQSARIDALSLRERVFLFVSVMACCMALVDVVWLSPAQVEHQQLTQRFNKQSAELQRVRDVLKTAARPVDGPKAARDEIADVKNRLDAVNQNITDVLPAATEVTPLAQVLVQFLRRYEGLTLVRTSAMAPEAVVGKGAQAVGAGAGPGAKFFGFTRQGVELTVSGPYPELTRYVQTLETALPYVRWGTMKLKSEKLPPELTLQLFLVGVQP
jgi:MSHA biogenesis protein MshJ